MKKIKVRVNIGPIYDTINIVQDFNVMVENEQDKNILFKAIESSVKKLNLESNKFMMGFIDVIYDRKKIFHTSLLKCGEKLSYTKDI